MTILLILAALLVLLLVIVLLKTLLLKPTSAKEAKVQLDTSERAVEYGKKLSTLVQKETISSRFDPDRTKFLEFHEILKEMFRKACV